MGAKRKQHSAEFKASVIQACEQPGVSMAGVALANGLNATMLRKWVTQARGTQPGGTDPLTVQEEAAKARAVGFIPLAMPSSPMPADIRIELQRGDTRIQVSWPLAAAGECGGWLRELLR